MQKRDLNIFDFARFTLNRKGTISRFSPIHKPENASIQMCQKHFFSVI